MCLYPKYIRNPHYKPNKQNGGDIPYCDDERKLVIPVGCGECYECRKKKAREWNIRLSEEIKYNKQKPYFVTLTFNDIQLNKLKKEFKDADENEICNVALRRFAENWRQKTKHQPRRFMITEKGGCREHRIHIHGIIWTDRIDLIKLWKYGFTDIGYEVTSKTINYIVKYITKDAESGHKSKIYASKGLGLGYINNTNKNTHKYKNGNTNEEYNNGRTRCPLPIYYRNKLYDEKEREELWINKLDKGVIYIDGIKIDTKDVDVIAEARQQAQKKNVRAGYKKIEQWEEDRYRLEQERLTNLTYYQKKSLENLEY